ncbi:hypothetical protein ACP70R_013410 [Stipagrostis hirtigluma subsp. patula]
MASMAPPPLKYRPCHRPDGLVSEEALRFIVEAKACFVALALALAYFLTASQHRLWSSSHLIKGFLFAVTQPVTRFLVGMFTMLLAMPFRNDLYLLWGILLLAGYEGVYTISGYGVSARRSDLAVHEFARGYNIVLLGLYVRYYSHASQFRYPLWALWALMVAKFVERIVRFKIANGEYGDANTSIVADYMKHEHELSKQSTTDGQRFLMKDCNYLIVGDSNAELIAGDSNAELIVGDCKEKSERVEDKYDAKYKPGSNTVTVAKVWECKGQLLDTTKSNTLGDELKDVCLSFALCKLLRRKFAGVAVTESERKKARRLVFDNLLVGEWQRTFRVVRTELGFARDLIYTKYPILFSSGFPVVSTVLFAVTLVVSLWITESAVRHYQAPPGSSSNVVHGRNVDLLITFAIVGMVTGMDICEFFIHLFSDWTKVMVIAEYVRKPWLQRPCLLNSVLRFVCGPKIAEPIGSSLGQFDLRNAAEQRCLPESIIKLYHIARSFVLLNDDDEFRMNKCKTLRPVPDDVQEMIRRTLLKNREDLIKGQERLQRRTELERDETLLRYCKAPTNIETIMVWHVATSKLEAGVGESIGGSKLKGDCNEEVCNLEAGKRSTGGSEPKGDCDEVVSNLEAGKRGSEGSKRQIDYKKVAATLSRYCAYLVFYKPKLLPIANNSVRYMCKKLLEEANSSGEQEGGIVRRGEELAEHLQKKKKGDDLWEALAELWCELIITMAPGGNISAHQKELGKGGEFITHLWALLYHAGIDDKFSGSSTGGGDAAARRDDHNSQSSLCSATPGSGNMT